MLASSDADRIRSELRQILSEQNHDPRVDGILRLCHALAVAAIKSKIAAGTLSEGFIGLKSGDIATDCIADLFHRDHDEGFVQLRAYFEGMPYESISNEELLTHFRRLVFSKVNDGLFRIYREMDPSLAKIIHGIKVVVNTLHNFDEVEFIGEKCIYPSLVDRLDGSPMMEAETLERGMRRRVRGTERIPQLMAALSLFLREQEEYCRIVPIVSVAIVFRSIYSEPVKNTGIEPTMETGMLLEDANRAIEESCHEVEAEMKPRYLAKKKVSSKNIDYYFLVIEQTLKQKFTCEDGKDESLFPLLKECLPNLKKEGYQKSHKKILEYLLKLSTDRAKKKLERLYR